MVQANRASVVLKHNASNSMWAGAKSVFIKNKHAYGSASHILLVGVYPSAPNTDIPLLS